MKLKSFKTDFLTTYIVDIQVVTPPQSHVIGSWRSFSILFLLAFILLPAGHSTNLKTTRAESMNPNRLSKVEKEQGIVTNLIATHLDTTPIAFTCGRFIDSNQAVSTSPDSIYYDGFGNRYPRNFANPSVSTLRNARNSCYFNLTFKEPSEFSSAIQGVFETVFEELCAYIPQRQLVDACNNPLPQYMVNIEVEWTTGLESNVVAAAAPVYYPEFTPTCQSSDATIVQSLIQRKINGHHIDPSAYGGVDGKLFLNESFASDFDTDYPDPVGSGLIDLYTTVMHEAFHLLGFQSLIEADASSGLTPMTGSCMYPVMMNIC